MGKILCWWNTLYFNVLYRSPTTFSFTDCQHDYRDNKNLYAVMLPPSCRVAIINPRNTIIVPHSGWRDTDLKHTLTLSKLSHVIITYQYTGDGQHDDYYFVLRIKINSVVQKHTVSHPAWLYKVLWFVWIMAGITRLRKPRHSDTESQ